MVTPSLTVLGSRSHTALPRSLFPLTHTKRLTNKHVDPLEMCAAPYSTHAETETLRGRDRAAQSVSGCGLRATPVL